MQTFVLVRDSDPTGISGTGVVAEGVVFSDGTVAMRWTSEHTSTAIYRSVEDVATIHGHEGATRIAYVSLLPH